MIQLTQQHWLLIGIVAVVAYLWYAKIGPFAEAAKPAEPPQRVQPSKPAPVAAPPWNEEQALDWLEKLSARQPTRQPPNAQNSKTIEVPRTPRQQLIVTLAEASTAAAMMGDQDGCLIVGAVIQTLGAPPSKTGG